MRRRPSFARILGRGVATVARGLTRPFGSRIGARAAAHAAAGLAPVVTMAALPGNLRFYCDSEMSAKRALGALRQEPDTLDWIDQYIRPGQHFWDVGANIGVYGLYACLRGGVSVTCFEPVASTFALLVRNAELNGVSARLSPLCLALSDADAIMPLFLSNPESGSSMHALNKAENVLGGFDATGVQSVLSVRGDRLVAEFSVPAPQHLKVDVDGHEFQVLEGMGALLDRVQTVWIEMVPAGESSGENARIRGVLNDHGLIERPFLPEKRGRNTLFLRRNAA